VLNSQIVEYVHEIGQDQLLVGLETIPLSKQEGFLSKIEGLNKALLEEQRRILHASQKKKETLRPLNHFDRIGNKEDQKAGEALIAKGKMGCIILAGGQGTRLGAGVSKGMIPISVVKNKSLFQIFFEKAHAASKRAGADLPLAVMTSSINEQSTKKYLQEHRYFELKEEQVDLFVQDNLPFLDDQGNWLLEAPGKIAEGPDGNGGLFKALHKSGIWDKWKKQGVEFVNVVLIDNPLADPFDAELCGYLAHQNAEVVIKAVCKEHSEEEVGVLACDEDQIKVIEYSELSEEQKQLKAKDGSLLFNLANISLFCFHRNFIDQIIKPEVFLPLHTARKQALVFKKLGSEMKQEIGYIWKCEHFIFDLLDYAKKVKVLIYPREKTFAPLKNATGYGTVQSVQKALIAADRATYAEVTGTIPPGRLFELDPQFYYPTPSFLERWKGKPLPSLEYIDAEL